VSIDKAFKNKVLEYKNLIRDSEGVLLAAQRQISEFSMIECNFDRSHDAFLKKLEETFISLAHSLDYIKNDLNSRYSKEAMKQRNSAEKDVEELKSLFKNACHQIDYQGVSLDYFNKEVSNRRNIIAQIQEIIQKPANSNFEVEFTLGDSELDSIIKKLRTELSRLFEKPSIQVSIKQPERLQTPSRNQNHSSKSNLRHQVEARPPSSINKKDAPLTPRTTKDLSKKSLTRSKSPIFKTDIRTISLLSC
jgi:hypothetical protein